MSMSDQLLTVVNNHLDHLKSWLMNTPQYHATHALRYLFK